MKWTLDPWAAVAGAFLVLVMPLKWLMACVTAAAFHEACHLLAAKLTGGEVEELTIGLSGARISARFPDQKGELLTALAGPVGSLLLLVLLSVAPRLALCGGVQGVYNLLPLYPKDGGRVLKCLLEMVLPQQSERLCRWAEITALLMLAALAVWGSFGLKIGIWPVAMVGVRCLRRFCQKNSLQIVGNRGTIGLPITKR